MSDPKRKVEAVIDRIEKGKKLPTKPRSNRKYKASFHIFHFFYMFSIVIVNAFKPFTEP